MRFAQIPLALAALVLAAAFSTGAAAAQKVAPINTDKKGVALHGYDAVTYFERDKPEKGKTEFSYSYGGATWLFVSAEDRKKFAQNREAFMPQFGGYCAKAVSEDDTADVDPLAYKIVNGKLYLNYDVKVQQLWEKDIPGRIANAEKYWPNLHRPE
jgi:YHS domain-containing protein